MRYFDTGILLKLYLPEPRANEAVNLVNASVNKPLFTPLHGLEMRSAIRQKAGRGEITMKECVSILEILQSDLDAYLFEMTSVSWPEVYDLAEGLSTAHGIDTLCRSLDTLHVALALELGAKEFCTFDHRQSKMAKASGLAVIS
jgi:predicted nucleic acid-binding protein